MEKEINRLKMRFLSLSANEKLARVAISGFVGLYDPTISDLNDIKTAVSEAVTNCIVHAYRDSVGEVEILAKAYKNGKIYIKIKDFGCGIADVKKAMEPLYTTLPEEERSGLGFSVMESFCDSVKVRSKVGVGTQVVLTKQLKPRL
ncbi:MAG: anti-sigma F factor [Oscillospiraceae bacterium]|nr:anti-sigma F factor [Oscillospiraceae bacterium]